MVSNMVQPISQPAGHFGPDVPAVAEIRTDGISFARLIAGESDERRICGSGP
jgi:hypothetical protein